MNAMDDFPIRRLIPLSAKSTSNKQSLPMGRALMIVPSPKTLWATVIPERKSGKSGACARGLRRINVLLEADEDDAGFSWENMQSDGISDKNRDGGLMVV